MALRNKMLIKSADSRNGDIETLEGLLNHPSASADTKRKIGKQISSIRSGEKGERDAAYEINFHYGGGKNWAVIHDLRLEHRGRVTQIDHLLINWLMEVWVCESKCISGDFAINEYGECSSFFDGKPYGIASPFEQNRKHCALLQAIFDDGAVPLEKRLGFSIKPAIHSLVLISKNARINRPEINVEGLGEILKVDQIKTRIDKKMEGHSKLFNFVRSVGTEAIENFAEKLAELHTPISVNWAAKFGLAFELQTQPFSPDEVNTLEQKRSTMTCISCERVVGPKETIFCSNKLHFGGNVYCYTCQQSVTKS